MAGRQQSLDDGERPPTRMAAVRDCGERDRHHCALCLRHVRASEDQGGRMAPHPGPSAGGGGGGGKGGGAPAGRERGEKTPLKAPPRPVRASSCLGTFSWG